MNPLLEQLHDIEGIDPVSVWPLAIGWWVVITIIALVICIAAWFLSRKLAFQRSWKSDTNQKLMDLEQKLVESNAREIVVTLSEYLRRIVLRRFPRKECAALIGKPWLKWLAEHDPKNFDWEEKGEILIEIPYAPNKTHGSKIPLNQVQELIQAVKSWVE